MGARFEQNTSLWPEMNCASSMQQELGQQSIVGLANLVSLWQLIKYIQTTGDVVYSQTCDCLTLLEVFDLRGERTEPVLIVKYFGTMHIIFIIIIITD